MAISVVHEMTMVSAGNGTGNEVVVNDLGFTPQADDLILISVGGEGNNPNPNTWVAEFGFQGGGTASATLIARDYGQDVGANGNSDKCQITVFGYVWQSGNTFDSLTIDHNRKKLVGLAVLRGAEVTGFPSIDWVTNQSATSFLSNLDQTQVNDVPVSGTRSSLTTDDLPWTWNSTNFGTEAAVWMAFSHRQSPTFTPGYPDADGASWTGDTLTAINMASGYQIRPDSSPGTQYEVRWDRTGTSTSYFAVLAIGIPAATATGTNRDLAGSTAATASGSGVVGVTRNFSGSLAGSASGSGVLARTAGLTGSLSASASASGVIGLEKGLQGSTALVASGAGILDRACALAGTGSATGTLQGAQGCSRAVQGSSAPALAGTGAVSRTCQLQGDLSATASGQGVQGVSRALQGEIQGTLQGNGSLASAVEIPLSGAGSGAATLTGSQGVTRGITAASTASASLTGSLSQTAKLQGATGVTGASQGAVQGDRALTGSAGGTGAATGTLELTGQVELTGTGAGTGSLSGSVAASLGLQGTTDTTGTPTGSVSRNRPLSGSTGSTGNLTGSAGVSRGITGTFTGTVTASGSLGAAASLELNGSALVQGTVQGQLNRSAGFQGSTALTLSLDGTLSRSADFSGASSSALSTTGFFQANLFLTGSSPGTLTGSAVVSVAESEPLLKQGGRNLVQIEVLTEEITYYLGGDLSSGKTIRAVVQRMEPEAVQYSYEGASLAIEVELWICTDSTLGIPIPQIGRDLVDVVVTEGQAVERCRVVEALEDDPGMIHLLAVR